MACDNPISIKNPNYKRKLNSIGAKLKDCTNQYIQVPCGHCKSCIANKQMQMIQRLQMDEKDYHLFYITLTYNEEMIPKIQTSNGVTLKYADIHDTQTMFKRIRKYNILNREYKYITVSELGGKKGRPHFHIILEVKKEKTDNFLTIINMEQILHDHILKNWARNIGTRKNPIYKQCCTYRKKYINGKLYKNYDLHYINKATSKNGEADVGFYVLKYMLKPSTRETRLQQALHLNLDEEEYNQIWKKIKSRTTTSRDFGNSKSPIVQQYIQECIEQSKNDEYIKYFNPVTGQAFPLSRKYKKLIPDKVLIDRYNNRKDKTHEDTPQEYQRPTENKAYTNKHKLERIQEITKDRIDFNDF